MNTEHTARAVILADGCMLALRPSDKPIFFTPGGRIKPSETTYAALIREMAEELPDIPFHVIRELGLIEHCWREQGEEMVGQHHFFHVAAPALSPPSVPNAVEPGLTFAWLPVSDLGAVPIQPPSLARLVLELALGNPSLWSARDV